MKLISIISILLLTADVSFADQPAEPASTSEAELLCKTVQSQLEEGSVTVSVDKQSCVNNETMTSRAFGYEGTRVITGRLIFNGPNMASFEMNCQLGFDGFNVIAHASCGKGINLENISAKVSEKSFASCSGYHHGSYVDFYTKADGSTYIEVSNDGEALVWPVYNITKMSDYEDEVIQSSDYKKSVVDAVKAMGTSAADLDQYLFVKASGPDGSQLTLNINNYFGDSFLVIDGYVEPLECVK